MITLRTMAAAFLFNGSDLLFMKRAATRKLAPGLWAAIGGHLEPHEINTPEIACLREIKEETGLQKSDLEEFKLKYIILRRKEDEIRVQYIYFGNTNKREVTETEEGDLFWINRDAVLGLDMMPATIYILTHYFTVGASNDEVFTGTINESNGTPSISWAVLRDYEDRIHHSTYRDYGG